MKNDTPTVKIMMEIHKKYHPKISTDKKIYWVVNHYNNDGYINVAKTSRTNETPDKYTNFFKMYFRKFNNIKLT